MKTLTIHPVWAWAIVHGHKPIENRTWRTDHRGPLAIHASAESPAARRSDTEARAILAELGVDVPDVVPTAAIVGTVDLVDIRPAADDGGLFKPEPLPGPAPLRPGPWCWLLEDPRPLDQPIPAQGRQSVWESGEEVARD